MAPFLDFAEPGLRSFADVEQTDAGINTVEFLEAAKGVVGILKLLEALAFKPVISDIEGNITKVRKRYDAAPDKSATLEQLVENEVKEGSREATQGLLWLTRGLLFTCNALQLTQANQDLELSRAFQESYKGTLEPFHSFFVKPVFRAALGACPARVGLYNKLREDKSGGPAATQEELDEKLNRWLAALEKIAKGIDKFLTDNDYKKGL